MKKVLYFTATWCGPCKSFAPIMEQAGQVLNVEKIDVDANPSVATAYQVRSVPTVVVLKDNREVSRFVGVKPLQSVLDAVNNA